MARAGFWIERGRGNGYGPPIMKIVKDGYSVIPAVLAVCGGGDAPKGGEA